MKPQLMSLLMGGITLLAVPAGAADETINCTATPNCADLGYTKNADSCPDGGIKCPFDENKMFCLRSADLGFQIKNDVKAGDILYTDGTSSATYTKGKGVVGLVIRAHPGNPRHALVLTNPYVCNSDKDAIQRLLSLCSGGLGKGIWGTGQYLAGVGEAIEIEDVPLSKLYTNYKAPAYSGSNNIMSGTKNNKSEISYYYWPNGINNPMSIISSTPSYVCGYCVIYL